MAFGDVGKYDLGQYSPDQIFNVIKSLASNPAMQYTIYRQYMTASGDANKFGQLNDLMRTGLFNGSQLDQNRWINQYGSGTDFVYDSNTGNIVNPAGGGYATPTVMPGFNITSAVGSTAPAQTVDLSGAPKSMIDPVTGGFADSGDTSVNQFDSGRYIGGTAGSATTLGQSPLFGGAAAGSLPGGAFGGATTTPATTTPGTTTPGTTTPGTTIPGTTTPGTTGPDNVDPNDIYIQNQIRRNYMDSPLYNPAGANAYAVQNTSAKNLVGSMGPGTASQAFGGVTQEWMNNTSMPPIDPMNNVVNNIDPNATNLGSAPTAPQIAGQVYPGTTTPTTEAISTPPPNAPVTSDPIPPQQPAPAPAPTPAPTPQPSYFGGAVTAPATNQYALDNYDQFGGDATAMNTASNKAYDYYAGR